MQRLKTIIAVALLANFFSLNSSSAADISAGQDKAGVCLGCHGTKGKSTNAQWPNLAAQQTNYLISQLNAFKSGNRTNPMMNSITANLNDDDIANLAAYFSSLPRVSAGGDANLAKLGQPKAAMCLGCHGASAEGNGQFPRLAGQYPDYLAKQLIGFKEGSRKNSTMQAIAGNLSAEEIQHLAAYFGSL
jgi:cytochrome c553